MPRVIIKPKRQVGGKKLPKSLEKMIEDTLKMCVEAHNRKQVQMHCVNRNIAQRFSAKIPEEFGQTFSYGKVFYSVLDNIPVTIEALHAWGIR